MRARLLCAAGAALVVGCSLLVVWACQTEEEKTYTLTVNVAGEGTVVVHEGDTGAWRLDCEGTSSLPPFASCSEEFQKGAIVDLSAEPFDYWEFGSWDGVEPGEISSTDPTLAELVMDADRTVTATFLAGPGVRHLLTVVVDGPGKVTAAAAGIDCGAGATACTAAVGHGTTVTLAATPGLNSGLLEWTWDGGRSEAASIDVLVDRNRTATATFRPLRTLTVEVVGSGSVTGGGISCPGTCIAAVVQGRAVTLTATPAAGGAFAGWTWASGSSAGLALDFVMGAADATYTATFTTAFQEGTYDLELVPVIATCYPRVVELHPAVIVDFSSTMPSFGFLRKLDNELITVAATTWDPATGHAAGQTSFAGNCVDLPVACLQNPTTNVCYMLQLDVTFTDANHFTGSLVVHQEMSPDCGASLCLTRYDPIDGARRAPEKSGSSR